MTARCAKLSDVAPKLLGSGLVRSVLSQCWYGCWMYWGETRGSMTYKTQDPYATHATDEATYLLLTPLFTIPQVRPQ